MAPLHVEEEESRQGVCIEPGAYILENILLGGRKNISRCHLGKKHEKAKRKRGKCKRKRKKGERRKRMRKGTVKE